MYLELEKLRFEDKLMFSITVDNSLDAHEITIPTMLVQPYVENAIWHGLRYKDEKGVLEVSVCSKGDNELEICVSDDGIGRKKSAELKTQNQKKQKSKGMGNIKQRVSILNDMHKDKVAIQILDLSKNGTGTKVIFTLKKDV
jgi:LytS/YehU family sensor histidine kinase